MSEVTMRLKEVAEMLGVCERTVFRLKAAGEMPSPIKIRKCVVWRQEDIKSWIAAGCPSCAIAQNSEKGE